MANAFAELGREAADDINRFDARVESAIVFEAGLERLPAVNVRV